MTFGLVTVPITSLAAPTSRQTTCILWNLVELTPGLTSEAGAGTFRQQPPGTIV